MTNVNNYLILLMVVIVVSIASITILDQETPEVLAHALTALIAYLVGSKTAGKRNGDA